MYQRKTEDHYIVQANYGYGWEDEHTELNRKLARSVLRDYRANAQYGQFRLIKKRVRKAETT